MVDIILSQIGTTTVDTIRTIISQQEEVVDSISTLRAKGIHNKIFQAVVVADTNRDNSLIIVVVPIVVFKADGHKRVNNETIMSQ